MVVFWFGCVFKAFKCSFRRAQDFGEEQMRVGKAQIWSLPRDRREGGRFAS